MIKLELAEKIKDKYKVNELNPSSKSSKIYKISEIDLVHKLTSNDCNIDFDVRNRIPLESQDAVLTNGIICLNNHIYPIDSIKYTDTLPIRYIHVTDFELCDVLYSNLVTDDAITVFDCSSYYIDDLNTISSLIRQVVEAYFNNKNCILVMDCPTGTPELYNCVYMHMIDHLHIKFEDLGKKREQIWNTVENIIKELITDVCTTGMDLNRKD